MWARTYDNNGNHSLTFNLKNSQQPCTIKMVNDPESIDQDAARHILVESFIGEYSQYLTPDQVKSGLTSWRDGENSVKCFYESYFSSEFNKFLSKAFEFWVEAYHGNKLIGWATFEREPANSAYMDLLIVLPEYQGQGVGKQLVQSLVNLKVINELQAVNVLLRKTNKAGARFYERIGFVQNPEYTRANFVDVNLLTGITWHVKPTPEHHCEETAKASPSLSRKC